MAVPGLLCLGAEAASDWVGRLPGLKIETWGTQLVGGVFGSKLPKMADFSPKTGIFRGVLFTTKVIDLSSISSDKCLI